MRLMQSGARNCRHSALRASRPRTHRGQSPVFAVKDDAGTEAKLKRVNVDVSPKPSRMRVSPSIYNNKADVRALIEALN